MPILKSRNFLLIAFTGALMTLFQLNPVPAHADVYNCVDSAGHTMTSDRAIPECAGKAMKIYKDNGTLIEQIAAPLTPAQRQAIDAQEKQRAKEALQKENLSHEQRFLVAHYPDEQSIETARKNDIDALEVRIAIEKKNIDDSKAALDQNQAMLPTIPAANSLKLNETKMKIANLTLSIQDSNHLIHNLQTEETNINQRYDATHKRYVEVVRANNH